MQSKSHHLKRWVLYLLILICLSAMGYCIYRIVVPLSEYDQGTRAYANLYQRIRPPATTASPNASPSTTPESSTQTLDFAALEQINGEFIGWLVCEGTVINYPVVQGDDNTYYLNHLFDGTRNKLGTLFVDCNNAPPFSDFNTVIYGHHMKNGSMFASLVNYKQQAYFDQHPTLMFLTPNGDYEIQLFSGYVTDAVSESFRSTFTDETDFLNFLQNTRKQSNFTSDVVVASTDRIVTLVTCTYEYSDARYVLHGKLVPLDETA